MSEENRALQRQLQQKHEKELEKLRAAVGEEWDDSLQSKEIEAKLLQRQEAALKRERALAYSFSHQLERYHHRDRYSSIAGSSVRDDDDDDESLASSPAFPSYMALTSSAKARSEALQRPSLSSSSADKHEKGVVFSAKKRLSFPATSPAGSRRHFDPPKV